MRFEDYQLGKRKGLISNDFTHIWALATYFATDDISCENTNDGQVEDREQQKMEE